MRGVYAKNHQQGKSFRMSKSSQKFSILNDEFFRLSVSWAKGYAKSFSLLQLSPVLLLGGMLKADEAAKHNSPQALIDKKLEVTKIWAAYSKGFSASTSIKQEREKLSLNDELQKIIAESSDEYSNLIDAILQSTRTPNLDDEKSFNAIAVLAQAIQKKTNSKYISAEMMTVSAYVLLSRGEFEELPSLANYLLANRIACEALIKKQGVDVFILPNEKSDAFQFSDEVDAIIKKSEPIIDRLRNILNLGLNLGTAIISEVCTAYHEAGHAVVSSILRPSLAVTKITIIPDQKMGAAGVTFYDPTAAYWGQSTTAEELNSILCTLLAGRAAQLIKFGPSQIDDGASSDIEEATKQAWLGVAVNGLDPEVGPINLKVMRELGEASSGWLMDLAQKRTQLLLKKAAEKAEHILVSNWHAVENVVKELLARKSLDEDVFFVARNLKSLFGLEGTIKAKSRIIQREVVFASRAEIIETHEGPVRVRMGDAIISESLNRKWPVNSEYFRKNYLASDGTTPGENGFYQKKPTEVLALKLADNGRVDLLKGAGVLNGKPGDWVVDYGNGDLAIVTEAAFDQLYEVLV